MTNQNIEVSKISEIIKVMQGGIDFYQEAEKEVDTEFVKNVFQRMVREKRQAIEALQPFAIAEQGERENSSDWMIDMRKHYTKLLGMFTSDEEHTYIDQLEEVEDKVLEKLDEAMNEKQPTDCMMALRSIRARAQQTHDEMKALQESTS